MPVAAEPARAAARAVLGPRVSVLLLLNAVLAGCEPRSADYATLAQARAAGVFEQRLLPDVLPPSAALIRVQADDATPAGDFHFSSSDYPALAARLQPLAQLPADPALKAWVQRKDLAGYDAFTLQDAYGRWLLLCAQSKGRCQVRALR